MIRAIVSPRSPRWWRLVCLAVPTGAAIVGWRDGEIAAATVFAVAALLMAWRFFVRR